MKFEEMSAEAQDVAKAMIEHCINAGLRMGMGEGFTDNGEKERFRKELERFINH